MLPTALDLTEEALELLTSGRAEAARMTLESLAADLRRAQAAGPARWRRPEGLARAGAGPSTRLRRLLGWVSTSLA